MNTRKAGKQRNPSTALQPLPSVVRKQSMEEFRRKSAEFRRENAGRKHTDSAELLREDGER